MTRSIEGLSAISVALSSAPRDRFERNRIIPQADIERRAICDAEGAAGYVWYLGHRVSKFGYRSELR